ncbi:MAG: DNA primase [Clostridiaceae bacterium]|nr:DNA primase [Clostridiaceae bacterium]
MAIPDRFIDELVERCDIVDVVSRYVSLKKQGSGYVGLCPFHSEKTPSFHVQREKGFFHCFGCGVGGGVIQFVMRAENLPFPEAVAFLAKQAGLTVPEDAENTAYRKHRETLMNLHRDAARFFFTTLQSPTGGEGLAYLRRRGLSDGIIRRFGLGFAPNRWDALMDAMRAKGYEKTDMLEAGLLVEGREGRVYDRFRNRVMFPILSLRGDVIGFGGRVMDDSQPKYLNSPETPIFAKGRNLFAMNLVKNERPSEILLAEGYMDVIALHQAGFRTAVASLGTALTPEQARLIKTYAETVVIVYDADNAGQKATARGIDILKSTGINVRILRIPDGKDPDEFIRKNGADKFEQLLRGTQGDLEYRLSRLPNASDRDTPEKKITYLKAAAELLATVDDPIERDVYLQRVAADTDTTLDALRIQVNAARKSRDRASRREETRRVLNPVRTVQPAARELRYDNPRAARAEEGIIALLFFDPTLILKLDEDNAGTLFTVPLYAKLYTLIKTRVHDGGTVSPDVFAQDLTPDEASQLSRILAKTPVGETDRAFSDYLAVMRQEHMKNASLQALIDAKKGSGGL